jgi:hypothetical protein
MPGIRPILGVRDRPRGRIFISELGAGDLDVSARLRQIHAMLGCMGLHFARSGAGGGSVLGGARAPLSLRSENRALG